MAVVFQDGVPAVQAAPGPYDQILFTNASFSAAAGANLYFLSALAAIVFACVVGAGRLWRDSPDANAPWRDASLTLLLVISAPALLAAIYVWVRRASGEAPMAPLRTWLALVFIGGAVAAAVAHDARARTAPDAGAWNSTPTGQTIQIVSASLLATLSLLGAVVQYADGTLRVDRMGAAAAFATAAFAAALLSFYAIVLFYSTGADAFPKNAALAGSGAAIGGTALLTMLAFAASALAARLSSAVASYNGVPVASSPESARFFEQTRVLVATTTLAALLIPLLVVLSCAGAGAATITFERLAIAAAAYAAWLPFAAAFAAAALRARALAPRLYRAISSLMIAAAVLCAAQLVPWTPALVWALAVLPALALLVALAGGSDGGARRLTVALALAGGFAAAQLLGSKWLALVPAAAVLLFLRATGRSTTPAVVFAGAVVASIADSGAGPGLGEATAAELSERALADDDNRAALAGRTAAALAAVLLVASELVEAADVTLGSALGGLAGIQGTAASPLARSLGFSVVVVFASLATRGVAGALSDTLILAPSIRG